MTMADDPKLIGTGRTPSEQDLFDQYMLSFITLREYLERSSANERVDTQKS